MAQIVKHAEWMKGLQLVRLLENSFITFCVFPDFSVSCLRATHNH